MSNKLDILNPVIELPVNGEKIVVREMAWPHALEFLTKLSQHAGKLVSAEGKFTVDFTKLAELIGSTQELSEFLLLKATGKDQAWLGTLTMRSALEVLDAALSVNLTPDMFDSAKKVEGRLRSLFSTEPASSTNNSAA